MWNPTNFSYQRYLLIHEKGMDMSESKKMKNAHWSDKYRSKRFRYIRKIRRFICEIFGHKLELWYISKINPYLICARCFEDHTDEIKEVSTRALKEAS